MTSSFCKVVKFMSHQGVRENGWKWFVLKLWITSKPSMEQRWPTPCLGWCWNMGTASMNICMFCDLGSKELFLIFRKQDNSFILNEIVVRYEKPFGDENCLGSTKSCFRLLNCLGIENDLWTDRTKARGGDGMKLVRWYSHPHGKSVRLLLLLNIIEFDLENYEIWVNDFVTCDCA